MARNTPTEILDNIKKVLVKDIINLWDTANINNSADKGIAPAVRNLEFDIKLKLLTRIVDMEVADD